jgi:hypothetical protein
VSAKSGIARYIRCRERAELPVQRGAIEENEVAKEEKLEEKEMEMEMDMEMETEMERSRRCCCCCYRYS